jgi:hypothetical protein
VFSLLFIVSFFIIWLLIILPPSPPLFLSLFYALGARCFSLYRSSNSGITACIHLGFFFYALLIGLNQFVGETRRDDRDDPNIHIVLLSFFLSFSWELLSPCC